MENKNWEKIMNEKEEFENKILKDAVRYASGLVEKVKKLFETTIHTLTEKSWEYRHTYSQRIERTDYLRSQIINGVTITFKDGSRIYQFHDYFFGRIWERGFHITIGKESVEILGDMNEKEGHVLSSKDRTKEFLEGRKVYNSEFYNRVLKIVEKYYNDAPNLHG